jgi:uncharacterized protein YbjQ (UPF0145 family)
MDDPENFELLNWAVILLVYGLPVLGLIFFGFIGSYVERKHYASIRAREAATAALPIVTLKTLDPEKIVASARLVSTAVVISHDHFKRFLANLRSIFGGRIRSYDTLMDRARREALLRLKAQCPEASIIANLRLETLTVAKSAGNRGVIAVEVIAYGTAVRYGLDRPTPASAS